MQKWAAKEIYYIYVDGWCNLSKTGRNTVASIAVASSIVIIIYLSISQSLITIIIMQTNVLSTMD